MAGNKQSFVLGVTTRERERHCIAQEGQEVFPILANVCNAAAYDLSPVSLKAKAASERKRERTYVHSQYCMAGRHRVGHYIQIELANVQDHNLPPA